MYGKTKVHPNVLLYTIKPKCIPLCVCFPLLGCTVSITFIDCAVAYHFITCSAVILYADWSKGVRPGAVHTL